MKKTRIVFKSTFKKRPREAIEDPNPIVILSQAFTATITEETVNTNPNLLSPFSAQTYDHNTDDALAVKLNRLKEKSARFASHKDYLSQCINKRFGTKRSRTSTWTYKRKLWPKNSWEWILQAERLFLNLTEDVVSFCDKTIKETNTKFEETKDILKLELENNEYTEIK